MKENELMIGDWVMSTICTPTPVKVYALGNNFIDLRYGNVEQSGVLFLCDFEPIPLTAKILEKNGFYYRNTQWYVKRFWSNGCFDIAVALNYREIEISKVCGSGTDCEEVDYVSTIAFGSDINVHELQHALRLCGITELADNFKVD